MSRPAADNPARQPGEPELKRCNGPLCNGAMRPIELFGLRPDTLRNGNRGRRSRCVHCDRIYGRNYASQRYEGRPARDDRPLPAKPRASSAPHGLSLAWIDDAQRLIGYDADCQRHCWDNPDAALVDALRAAGILADRGGWQ